MKLLVKFGCILTLSFAVSLPALAQYPQNPAGTPPTFPEGTKQNPDATQTQPQNPDQYPQTSPNPKTNPDQYPSQNPDQTPTAENPAPPPSSLTQARSAVENAIRKQMPSSADNVTVGITDDNRIRLSGNVNTEQEKQQIEQVAQSAAPEATIVNGISVGNPPSGPNPPRI